MKQLIIILLFSSNFLYAQPTLKKIDFLPELPLLRIDQFNDTSDILSFSHREGIILYNQIADDWKLYRLVKNHEEKGKIIKIQKVDNIILISMEFGSLIVTNNQILSLESTLLSTFLSGESLVALSSRFDSNLDKKRWVIENLYNKVTQIIIFNTKTATIDTIKLNKSFYRIFSSTFHNNKFWVSVIYDEGEYWGYNFLEIDLLGNVIEHNTYEKIGFVKKVFSHANNLYAVGDSGLYTLNKGKPLSKIVDIENCSHYESVYNNNHLYFILNLHPDHGSREMEYIKLNLRDFSFEKNFFICDANSLNYSEYDIHKKKLLCKNEYMDRIDKIDIETPHSNFKYSIREGITSYPRRMVEDHKDIWFSTSYNGLSRFSKFDSRWKNYSINNDLRIDSLNFLFYEELTLNEDYIFMPLKNNNGRYLKYLIFDRSKESFLLLTKEEFRSMFLFYEGRFANYKGHQFFGPKYNEVFQSVINSIPVWSSFLFLYDLPLTGTNNWGASNRLISNEYASMLSISVLDPPKHWYWGIMIKYKGINTLKKISYPRHISNFDASGEPYLITGDDEMVYVAGNSGDGIFTYRIMEEIIESRKEWQNKLHDIRIIKDTENYIIIGNYRGSIYAFEKATQDIIELNSFIWGTPMTVESSEKYIYIGTNKGLIYFDIGLNYLGELSKRSATLYKTEFNTYVHTEGTFYKIIEE